MQELSDVLLQVLLGVFEHSGLARLLNWVLSLLARRSGGLLPVDSLLPLEFIRVVFGLMLGFSLVVSWPVLSLLLSPSEILLVLVLHVLSWWLLLAELLWHHALCHHRVELLLEWHSHSAEWARFSAHHHRVELLHHEWVHEERVEHDLRELSELLVSVFGFFEMVELVFFDEVGQVHGFVVEGLDLSVIFCLFDCLFGALFVEEVDVPEIGVGDLVWVFQGERGVWVWFVDHA